MSKSFSPSEVSNLTGISVDNLRDWRRRGFMDGIGYQNSNGRWSYSLGNVLLLSSVPILMKMGLGLKPIMLLDGQNFSATLADWIQFPEKLTHRFLLVFPIEPDGTPLGGNIQHPNPRGYLDDRADVLFDFVTLEDVARISVYSEVGGFLIDLKGFVQQLPEKVISLRQERWHASS